MSGQPEIPTSRVVPVAPWHIRLIESPIPWVALPLLAVAAAIVLVEVQPPAAYLVDKVMLSASAYLVPTVALVAAGRGRARRA